MSIIEHVYTDYRYQTDINLHFDRILNIRLKIKYRLDVGIFSLKHYLVYQLTSLVLSRAVSRRRPAGSRLNA